jgi:hypothetical protein
MTPTPAVNLYPPVGGVSFGQSYIANRCTIYLSGAFQSKCAVGAPVNVEFYDVQGETTKNTGTNQTACHARAQEYYVMCDAKTNFINSVRANYGGNGTPGSFGSSATYPNAVSPFP